MKIICFGPGPAFKGGISNYNTSLAKALATFEGVEVSIVSWTQQYPGIVPRDFKDRVSQMNFLEGTQIRTHYLTNYNNPFSWAETASFMASQNPDIVIFQWSIAIQGLPLNSIIRQLKKKSKCEVIVDLHFVIQKEQSTIDRIFTKMGIGGAHSYVVHALKTFEELKTLYPSRKFFLSMDGSRSVNKEETTVIKLFHPIYDLYKPDPAFDVEAFKKENGLAEKVILFFGFIRKYKGLHQVIEAFNEVAKKREDVSLLICGESFWNTLDPGNFTTRVKKTIFGLAKKVLLRKADDEANYQPLELISKLGLEKRVVVFNQFIPNEDVHKYFQVSDCVVLYYLTATPSGIESLSYNFDLPILATRVGHFPETIEEGVNGYLADEDLKSRVETMEKMLDEPIDRSGVAKMKDHMSWKSYAEALLNRKFGA
ncbi:MAG: glycosyltransferase [Saprospiraceae bacterium]|nr:glycosyltransferase [Saprospiraceae bacterium]